MKTKTLNITQEYLKEIIDYDPETGVFTWKKPRPRIQVGNRAGYPHHKGHWEMEIDGKAYRLHQLAWLYIHGTPIPAIIDHRDGVKSRNAIANLRAADNGQNRANSKANKNSSLGVKGVTKNIRGKLPYRAQITVNGITKNLGTFATIPEAKLAYDEAAKKAFGEFFHNGSH